MATTNQRYAAQEHVDKHEEQARKLDTRGRSTMVKAELERAAARTTR